MKIQCVPLVCGIAVPLLLLGIGCRTSGGQSANARLIVPGSAKTTYLGRKNDDQGWYEPPRSLSLTRS